MTRVRPHFTLLLSALLFLTACRRHDFPQFPADYRECAYVTNGGSNTVTVLDLVNMRQDRVIRVGDNPTGIAANPVKNEIYAVNTDSNSISVIDAKKNAVVATIPVHSKPYFIDVDTKGERGYVANSGSNNVSVIDLAARREIAAIGVGEAPGMARISRDVKSLVVSNRVGGSISVVDPRTYKVRSVFSGCPAATDIAILPDSSKAFVTCSGGHQVMVIGLAQPESPIADEHVDRLVTFLDVGQTPVQLALKPDGGEIFVSNFGSDTISEIATQTNEVGGAYLVGAHPAGAIVSADNSTLWISKFNTGSIEVYSIDDGKVINTVHVGEGPDALAFSVEGHLLLAADAQSNDISVVRVLSRTPAGVTRVGTLFTMLPAGMHPNAIVVKAFRVK
ncbi:YncE family protein [Alloacidobacterium sp.]|uniref:YncE family protein n=1 Tax=Alloacidobacterium sp. TaxID=2951999 RepID=UPI002D240239|nr:YncE family protein [Alloacidobacterium sp.]HYK36136.1 YncE family protein [Alloacidobacterium sp.]